MHSSDTNESVIGIVGAPNSGKTTLFNWITGSKFRAVNYPGSTVDCYLGESLSVYGDSLKIMDTPGTYSLFPQSPDEEVTHNVLFHPHKIKNQQKSIKKVIVVVDATQIKRHFYLVRQVQEAGFPFVVALTMNDLIQKENLEIDIQNLSKMIQAPIIPIDGVLGGGVKELVSTIQTIKGTENIIPVLTEWSLEKISFINAENEKLINANTKNKKKHLNVFKKSARIDKVLLHPVAGYFIFAAIMITLFSSIFWIAAPFMDWVDAGFSWLGSETVSLLGENLFSDLIANGIIASFAAVLIFVPQIFILFLVIGVLEDSGYLARASTLIDRLFSKVGMNGRSFVPILSGFACAIPAMMAARTLGSKKERWITLFIIPLMTCSARLPVYALLLTFLFYGKPAWMPGIALTGLYLLALAVGMVAAGILNKIVKNDLHSSFIMELPLYRTPKIRVLLKNSLLRTQSYIRRAGPIIFVLAIIIWTASTFPNYQNSNATEKLQTSYLGQVGHVVEPIFEPMGLDWRAGIGMLTAFAAREVFVSTLAVMFNVTDTDNDDTLQASLLEKMNEATNRAGVPIFTIASVLGLVLFFMIALQCMSTVGVAIQEFGSWKTAIAQLVVLNVAAYVIAVVVVQSLRAFGIP